MFSKKIEDTIFTCDRNTRPNIGVYALRGMIEETAVPVCVSENVTYWVERTIYKDLSNRVQTAYRVRVHVADDGGVAGAYWRQVFLTSSEFEPFESIGIKEDHPKSVRLVLEKLATGVL